MDQAGHTIEEFRAEIAKLKFELCQTKSKLEEEKQKSRFNSKSNEVQGRDHQTEEAFRRTTNANKKLFRQNQGLKKRVAALEDENYFMAEEIDELKKNEEELRKNEDKKNGVLINDMERKVAVLEEELSTAKDDRRAFELHSIELEHELKEARKSFQDLENESKTATAGIEKELEKAKDNYRAYELHSMELEDELKRAASKSKDQENEYETAMEIMKKELTDSKDDCRRLEKRVDEIQADMQQMEAKYLNECKELSIKTEELAGLNEVNAQNKEMYEDKLDKILAQNKEEQEKQNGVIQDLEENLKVAVSDEEKASIELYGMREKVSILEKENVQVFQELKDERKSREQELEDLAGTITRLCVEKGCLMELNRKMAMKKNRLGIKYGKLEEDFKNQTRILLEAQESLRELEQEKYERRLKKRKGLKKLKFW